MKRLITLATAAVVMLSAAGCAGGASAASTGGTNGGGQAEPQQTEQEQPEQTGQSDEQAEENTLSVGEIAGEITVSAYETVTYKSFLEEAAAAFEEKYPGTKVNVSTFSAMPEVKTSESEGKKMSMITMEQNTQAEQDYINKNNTELMSGGGADVLAMDILPYYKYAESGQLEDLNAYMNGDPDFNKSDYRENILKAMQYKGGQYVFPLDYSFDYFAYDSSLFNDEVQAELQKNGVYSYEQLIEMGIASFDTANDGAQEPIYMFGANPKALFDNLFNANYSKFIDIEAKTANFNSGEFVELLNAVKEYEELGYIKPGSTDERGQMSMEAFEQRNQEQFLYKAKPSGMLLQQFNTNQNMRMMFAGGMGSGNEENDEIAGSVSNDRGQNAFTYSKAFGMNSNSANKATAWAFIRFLAEEMQTSMQMMGSPVNMNALAENTKQNIIGIAGPGGKGFEETANDENAELDEEQQAVYDNYMAEMSKLSGQLNTYYIQDQIINNTLDAELNNYFNGSKTAEEVADMLQNKIELYLNE